MSASAARRVGLEVGKRREGETAVTEATSPLDDIGAGLGSVLRVESLQRAPHSHHRRRRRQLVCVRIKKSSSSRTHDGGDERKELCVMRKEGEELWINCSTSCAEAKPYRSTGLSPKFRSRLACGLRFGSCDRWRERRGLREEKVVVSVGGDIREEKAK